MDTKIMIATEPDWIRSAITNHRKWIESVQGVTIEKMVVLQVSNTFTRFAANQILRDIPLKDPSQGSIVKLEVEITSIEYPGDMPPLMRARNLSKSSRTTGERQGEWDIDWGDTPVAFRFKCLQGAIVVLELPHHEHDSTCWSEVVICRQDEVASVMAMIGRSNIREEGALYSTGKGFKSIKSSSWDDLVLDDGVLQLVKKDYESFFAREDWFRNLKLPFRRGYLLHGPPGER